MTKHYIVKEQEGKLMYDSLLVLKSPEALAIVNHDIRLRILKLLSKEAMYPAQIAKSLGMHEQKVYYHIKQMQNADILEITEREEIRGTVAKKLRPKELSFGFTMSNRWRALGQLTRDRENRTMALLKPFMKDDVLDAKIVVGSPDPHGPHKARARDGHYAIDLALYIGSLCSLSKAFVTHLDVDLDLTKEHSNLIVIGGPVTNLIMARVNDHLPARFSDKEPWGITTPKTTYTDESIGLIASIKHPYSPDHRILAIAGIRYSGTRAAIMGLSRHSHMVLNRLTSDSDFYAVVQGFDLDGDGRIDSVELLE
jgi:DNA-binding transcriptional ArsR family regulator